MRAGWPYGVLASSLIAQAEKVAIGTRIYAGRIVNSSTVRAAVLAAFGAPTALFAGRISSTTTVRSATLTDDEGVAHSYYRVQVLDNNGSGFTSIGCQLNMYVTTDGTGTNQVTGGTLTGSAPGVFGNDLPNLLDGIDGSQWAVSETGNDYVTYQFPSAVSLHSIKMKVVPGQEALMPSHFKILSSDDGSTFTTLLEITSENWLSGAGTRVYSF